MVGIEIRTSRQKNLRLWPSEYWKALIDALTVKGSKNDPRIKYRDLTKYLNDVVEVHYGRFYVRLQSQVEYIDDVSLWTTTVRRVNSGEESLIIRQDKLLQTGSWHSIMVDYFGTIGDNKAEAQTKLNKKLVSQKYGKLLKQHCLAGRLAVSFQLSTNQKYRASRDRDLDNLADAMMPLFNRHLLPLDSLVILKEPPRHEPGEILRFSFQPVTTE